MRLKLEYKIAVLVLVTANPMRITDTAFQGGIPTVFPEQQPPVVQVQFLFGVVDFSGVPEWSIKQ